MKDGVWTYELPPVGADSQGLEDYEARTADGEHVGVVVGLVRRDGEMYLLVDAGVMPPLIHRRIAVAWQYVARVDHSALTVELALDRAGLEEAALALDASKAVHGPGAAAARVTRLPRAFTHPGRSGVERPVTERGSAFVVLVLAAAAPFSMFMIVAVWIARGLAGSEYGLLAIPLLLATLAFALEGYRLYREPHVRSRGLRAHPG
jgi:hypothetical protein